MALENLNKAPTAFKELRILESVYSSEQELHARLGSYGYQMLSELKVPSVRCFLFVPDAFPRTKRKTVMFDFSRYAGSAITVGVCIGGTTICSGWDIKFDLFCKGLMKTVKGCEKANVVSSKILRALTDFQREYPMLSTYGISLDVRICGYSLGGLFAQATTVLLTDWARLRRHKISCRTYDCPGVQDYYHKFAHLFYDGQSAPWRSVIVNFKSMPGPLNTVFKDIGGIVHLYNPDTVTCDAAWIASCIVGSIKRVTYWMAELESLGELLFAKDFNLLDSTTQMVVTGTAIATQLGIDIADVIRYHRISTMLECFDGAGALMPNVCIEMNRWPIYSDFAGIAVEIVKREARELNPFCTDNAGLHTLFGCGGKRGFIERRLANLPGYCPTAARRFQ